MSHVIRLGRRMRGPVVDANGAAYDQLRQVWNGAVDRYPAVIARPVDVGDVSAAVGYAREHGIPLSVRGGGHSVLGYGVRDDALMVDLSLMRAVHVDVESRTALVEGGATWADVDAATQRYGLATTGGSVSSTGVGGLSLAGGFGHLLRAYGLTVDNLAGADLVTADGSAVRVDDATDPELMWGLRGGGGNFGIATRLEFRLHPVGPQLPAGAVFWPLDQVRDVLGALGPWVATAPDELGVGIVLGAIPPLPGVPGDVVGTLGLGLLLSWVGDPAQGAAVLARIRGIGRPAADLVASIPYVRLQSLLDRSAGPGQHAYWRSHRLDCIDDPVVDVLIEAVRTRPTPGSLLNGWLIGGAASRAPADATAVGARPPGVELRFIAVGPPGAADPERQRSWVLDAWDRLAPRSIGQFATFLSDEGPDGAARAFGERLPRLAALKRRTDPENVFDRNVNIPPQQGEPS